MAAALKRTSGSYLLWDNTETLINFKWPTIDLRCSKSDTTNTRSKPGIQILKGMNGMVNTETSTEIFSPRRSNKATAWAGQSVDQLQAVKQPQRTTREVSSWCGCYHDEPMLRRSSTIMSLHHQHDATVVAIMVPTGSCKLGRFIHRADWLLPQCFLMCFTHVTPWRNGDFARYNCPTHSQLYQFVYHSEWLDSALLATITFLLVATHFLLII